MRLPIRQVPVRRLASAAARWISLADGKLASPDEIDDPTAALRSDRPPNGGKGRKLDEVHYQQVAYLLTTARESGFSPREYVAERLGPASVPNVERWITEAKRRGYLRRDWSTTHRGDRPMSTATAPAEHPRKRGERTDSSIKKLPNGKGWRARPTLGADPGTGKQVRPTRVFATKKAAQGWVTEQRQQWNTATWAPKSSRTFDEVADHWLTLREADTSIGPNTVRADRESLAYARRAFGAVPVPVPVQKLAPAALANWSATLTGKGGRTLAPATKGRAIVRLKSVMAHARKMRWLTYDPSADLESPEQKAVTATAADDIWTPDQMGTFLDHVAAHRLGGCFALTLLGLRREEVGGLRWSDVDLDAGALRIRQARVDVNGRDTIVATKTKRSARDLPLPPHELAMVKATRTFHLRERLAVGRPLADDDLLLSRADGTRLPVRDYSREFAAQRKAAGLKVIPLGKLRHSNISRMRAAGVAADVVAAWHGHTERMTQAVYGRVTDNRLTAASAVFEPRALGQS